MIGDNRYGGWCHHTIRKTRFFLKGFTSVEMLIVITVFAILSVTVAATYVNFTRLHRRVANAELLGEELRFATELIVRAARNNVINYPPLPGQLTSPTSSLALQNYISGNTMIIQQFSTSSAPCAGLQASCLALSVNGGSTWAAITGKRVNIDRFQVYINPVRTPFQYVSGGYDNDIQPYVIFDIDASYVAASPLERASLSVETAVTSRLYLR